MRTNSLAACSYKSLVEVVCLLCYKEGAMLSLMEEKTKLGLSRRQGINKKMAYVQLM